MRVPWKSFNRLLSFVLKFMPLVVLMIMLIFMLILILTFVYAFAICGSPGTCVKALAFQAPNKSPFEAQYKDQSLLFEI